MAAQQTPVPARDAGLSEAGKRRLEEIRATNALVATITAESWGQKMAPEMRRAFAEYLRRYHLDVSEIDNLGGRPYRNGNYYKRRLAEMRREGRIEWSEGEHIGVDPRLDALETAGDEWARAENRRRLVERIRLAVPPTATHAYVVRVKLKGDEKALEGCDWIEPSKVKKVKRWENGKFAGWEEKPADPVGIEEPTKTVETRAWRRAGLLVAAEIPELRREEAALDEGAQDVEARVATIAEDVRTLDAEAHAALPPRGHMQKALGSGDGYDLDLATPAREPVRVAVMPERGREIDLADEEEPTAPLCAGCGEYDAAPGSDYCDGCAAERAAVEAAGELALGPTTTRARRDALREG